MIRARTSTCGPAIRSTSIASSRSSWPRALVGAGGVTSGLTGLFPFEQEQLTLSEALAKAGGLVDGAPIRRSSSTGWSRATWSSGWASIPASSRRRAKYIPTVYRANFRDPSVFFAAQRFPMRNKDAIFVATADSVELEKFIAHSQAITSYVAGTATDVLVTRDAIRALRR